MRSAQVALMLAVAASASAQSYVLLPSSTMQRELCPPPCACTHTIQIGPLSRFFGLYLLDSIPPYTRYTLNVGSWSSPLGSQGGVGVYGTGIYTIGGPGAPMQRLEMTLSFYPASPISQFDSGFVPVDPAHPFPAMAITVIGEANCERDQLRIIAAPIASVCYANCDESTNPPILNVNDLMCFLNAYATGNMWADCDQSHLHNLTANDFQCFLNAFVAGCS